MYRFLWIVKFLCYSVVNEQVVRNLFILSQSAGFYQNSTIEGRENKRVCEIYNNCELGQLNFCPNTFKQKALWVSPKYVSSELSRQTALLSYFQT